MPKTSNNAGNFVFYLESSFYFHILTSFLPLGDDEYTSNKVVAVERTKNPSTMKNVYCLTSCRTLCNSLDVVAVNKQTFLLSGVSR